MKIDCLRDMVTNGGVVFLDKDSVATEVLLNGMTLVEYIIASKLTLPNGEVGKWVECHDYEECVVLTMEYEGDDYCRVAIVHVRTCNMFDTDPNKKIDMERLGEMFMCK